MRALQVVPEFCYLRAASETERRSSGMEQSSRAEMTGGCQCGAVRYRAVATETAEVAICHCRMCQKASGNYFQAFAAVTRGQFRWTRGTPGAFRSSELIERDFCTECGTPLTYRPLDDRNIWVTVGTLDHPTNLQPGGQYGIESQIIDLKALAALPGITTQQQFSPDQSKSLRSRQHPDHD
jgi:hypothetical protein